VSERPRALVQGFAEVAAGRRGRRPEYDHQPGDCAFPRRINTERIDEALALDPDTISTACPYCMVMLDHAVNTKKAAGQAKQTLEVIDVAQLLVRAVKLREDGVAAQDRPGWESE
jgi:Fe-S oxidoreductase